jgi:predicted DNA-binding protein (UPF0251 family)
MSPRPFRLRKISNPPVISGFKPYGNKKNEGKTENVFLYLEEYEALRLCDYDMLNHEQAAILMAVSRPTLSRIYSKARQKIAEAFVLGKQIVIEGGKIYFDSEWYSCKSCGCYFNNPEKQEEIKECPLCRSTDIQNYQPDTEETEETENTLSGCTDICICLSCGFETPHRFGCPCKDEICPECGNNMVRKGAPHIRNF